MFFKIRKKLSILTSIIILLSTSSSFADINVNRIAGKDRYDTAIKVNDKFLNSSKSNYAIISKGLDFRTSLYASYMASAFKSPLYLNKYHGMTTKTLDKLKENKVKKVFVIGGYDLMDKSIDNTLISKGIKFQRIYDKKEYDKDTKSYIYNRIPEEVDSIMFAHFHPNEPRGDISSCILINDKVFPDMLSITPLSSQLAVTDITGMFDYKPFESKEGYKLIIGGSNTVPEYYKTYTGDDIPGLNLHSDDDTDFKYYSGRLAGKDRYQTAIEIAKAYKPLLGYNLDTIILVNGQDYPDALASTIGAVSAKAAILLTQPEKLNSDTEKFIKENKIKNVIIIGGEKSVSKNIENKLKE